MGRHIRGRRAPSDGQCVKHPEGGGGRCPRPRAEGSVYCEQHQQQRRAWAHQGRRRRPVDEEGQPVQPPLPDWMTDRSLLPKKPPGGRP